MKIIVINASPKTSQSITLQHMRFLELQTPEHEFETIHIGSKISAFEKHPKKIIEIAEKIKKADALVWSYPVYYALVPYQLKRFIELLFQHCGNDVFKGLYATSFSTSINFFDHTAHNYMQGVSEQLGFRYIDSYSAHMDDFFKKKERTKMIGFLGWFIEIVKRGLPVPRKYHITLPAETVYSPDFNDISKERQPTGSSNILLLTDEQTQDANLKNMTQMFIKLSGTGVTLKNIHDIDIKNGCLGCCTCGYDNTCVQKDGFMKFYNDHVKAADTIIIAGSIKDHYLSAKWKQFFDRSFFNGHVPVLKGKRIGFIISGPLQQRQNLRETLDALTQT